MCSKLFFNLLHSFAINCHDAIYATFPASGFNVIDIEIVTFCLPTRIINRSDFSLLWICRYVYSGTERRAIVISDVTGWRCRRNRHVDLTVEGTVCIVVARQNRSLSSFNGKVVQLHRYRRSERRFGFSTMYRRRRPLSRFSSLVLPWTSLSYISIYLNPYYIAVAKISSDILGIK